MIQEFIKNPNSFDKDALAHIIRHCNDDDLQCLISHAGTIRNQVFGKNIFMRALVEVSSYCKQNCYYCGLRASNQQAERYRLTIDQVQEYCQFAYKTGYRSFVLQGGEDPVIDRYFADIIRMIRNNFPECALTISLGEKTKELYQDFWDAGAHRYLLRHEAANERLYSHIHPADMKLSNRMRCMQELRDIGFQVGAGFMVGLPTQTEEDLADDLIFVRDWQPHMVGIGPFLTHQQTPFAKEKSGTVRQTILMIALSRILVPKALIPSTTALGTLDPMGREQGFAAGGNVVMPNVCPKEIRKKYLLYDNKIGTNEGAEDSHKATSTRILNSGYTPCFTRGDHPDFTRE